LSYESHKYYNGNLYASMAKNVKNQLLDLCVNITMNVKKTSNYLQKIYVGIIMDVKKPATIYKTNMWILHIWNDLMENIIERM